MQLINLIAKLKEMEAKVPGEYRLNEMDLIGNTTDSIISESDGIFDEIFRVRCFAHQNAGQYQVRRDTSKFLIDLRNAAPKLLDVLGMIRAGDVKRLDGMLRCRVINEICNQEEIDMLDRIHEMCCKMERKE